MCLRVAVTVWNGFDWEGPLTQHVVAHAVLTHPTGTLLDLGLFWDAEGIFSLPCFGAEPVTFHRPSMY